MFLVCVGIFVARVTPVQVDGDVPEEPQVVSFEDSHIDWLDENYNRSMENGFCLFGRVQGDKVVVEDVEFVDNPFGHSYGSIIWTCVPQVVARSKQLLLQDDYDLVGKIHTHPEHPTLSEIDRDSFDWVDLLIPVYGVYNGSRLAMFSDPGDDASMTMIRGYE